MKSHKKYKGAIQVCKRLKILRCAVHGMACHNCKRARSSAVCYRDTDMLRNSDRRAYSRNYAAPESCVCHSLVLFAAAAEYKGVSALKPDYSLPFACLVDKNPVDLFLFFAVPVIALTDIDLLAVRADKRQQTAVYQIVIDKDLSAFQHPKAFHSNKSFTASGSDQVYITVLFHKIHPA